MQIKLKYETIKKSKGTNTKEFIVLHHTGSKSSAENNAKYLALNPAQASCHYVVGSKGEIYKIGMDDDILWHCGESSWNGRTNLNRYSIGIEVNSDGVDFTDEQRKSVKELIEELMREYDIPYTNVLRHKDIAPKRKTDIGDNFWNEYKSWKSYQKSLKVNDVEILAKMLWVAADELGKKCSDIQEMVVSVKTQAHEVAEESRKNS